MAVKQGNLAKLFQSGIQHHEEMERQLADPNNKFLADEIIRLREQIELQDETINNLPKAPNQWNPQG